MRRTSSSRPWTLLGGSLTAVILGVSAACVPTQPTIDPTLSALQEELFTPTCATASCHGGAAPSRGLDMNAGATHNSNVDADAVEPGWTRIVPGDTDASLFYQVLLEGVGNTRRMPPGFALDEGEIAAVRVWIEEGAQDN